MYGIDSRSSHHTSTFYPKWYQGPLRSINHTDKIRGDLALELIHKAAKQGYAVVVIDGLSTKTFYKTVKNIPGVILKRRISYKRSPARRLSCQVASKIPQVEVIFYTEPEKVDIATYLPQIIQPLLRYEADIVIPKRELTAFKSTYPGFQYLSEEEGNKLYNEYMHLHHGQHIEENFDMFFGPRAFRNKPTILHYSTKVFIQVR